MYLKITNLRKRYDGRNVLNKVTFIAGNGERIGLIGKNGAGKTTLLRLIAGLDIPTSGKIEKDPPRASIGYHQQVVMERTMRIEEFILSSISYLWEIKEKLQQAFDQKLLEEYEIRGGFIAESRIKATLQKLGLGAYNERTPIATLSGGEKTRLQLAPILLIKPDILLLDEPTNHLDIDGITFLENYIKNYQGLVIIATHDVELLKNCASRMMELDEGKLLDIHTSYTNFYDEKDRIKKHSQEEYKMQKQELKKLHENLAMFQESQYLAENQKRIVRKDNDKMGFNFLAEKAARKFSRRADVVRRKIDNFENLEKPQEGWKMMLDLHTTPQNKLVWTLKDISITYGKQQVIRNFSYDIYSHEKIALVGPNGSGKTTLLKTLANQMKPDSGEITRNESVHVGYLSQDHLEIDVTKTIIEDFLNSTEVNEAVSRTYLHRFLFKDSEVYRHISTFSQGEKAKYAFAKMLFFKPDYLLLDEPTNYMDIESKEIIIQALDEFPNGMIIATHDRQLLKKLSIDRMITLDKNTKS